MAYHCLYNCAQCALTVRGAHSITWVDAAACSTWYLTRSDCATSLEVWEVILVLLRPDKSEHLSIRHVCNIISQHLSTTIPYRQVLINTFFIHINLEIQGFVRQINSTLDKESNSLTLPLTLVASICTYTSRPRRPLLFCHAIIIRDMFKTGLLAAH